MIDIVSKILGKFGDFINRHLYVSIILIVLISIFAVIGATKITFQSDLDKMNPQNIPIIRLNDRVSGQFSTGDAIVVLLRLDPTEDSDIVDIRDPAVISFTSKLKTNLEKENLVTEVASPSDVYFMGLPQSLEQSKETLSQIPGSESFFGEGYDWAVLFVRADVGNDESKIRQLNERIEEIILESGKPAGVNAVVTGTPSLMAVMFNLLIRDSIFTLIAASILIFILIIIIERSLSKSIVVMLPLLFGLLWTVGAIGWLEIPITIATAGLSAMLLGLGVEYSIFLFSRYEEERVKKSSPESIIKALSTTGSSTIASGLTTVIGFWVLTFSAFPMLADMGATLALGITLILFAVMFTSPVVIRIEDKLLRHKKIKKEKEGILKKSFEGYGKVVSRAPFIVIIAMIILTILMFSGMGMIKNQDIDFDTVLPADLPQLKAFQTIQNERGQTEDIILFFEVVPTEDSTLRDIREQEAAVYVDLVSQKLQHVSYFDSISSFTQQERSTNDQRIISSFHERREYFNSDNPVTSTYFNNDYSGTIVRLNLVEDVSAERGEALRQVKEILENTEGSAGVKVSLVGNIAINEEMNAIMGPDSTKTAIYAFIGVSLLLIILSRSIKYTILPLLTVVFAIFWTLGLIGFSGLPFNSITSSVLSITIGIGIDFGLQLSMRYRYDRQTMEKKEAMTETLKQTLYPMIITVIAALIGFQAMTLGNLKLMGDLGTTMGFSIVSSMIVAVSIVAALILVFDRKNGKTKGKVKVEKKENKNNIASIKEAVSGKEKMYESGLKKVGKKKQKE